ncbi:hypothetical protein A4S06_03660 [Erysipelotrichaceae bacterium MTC7]|nr:hypothetical protein A4S06_03660 [Erysipelotrichaceae bacterium MTC7]
MKTLTVKHTTLGLHNAKICVPIVETTETEILKKVEAIVASKADMMEWRVDFYEHVLEEAKLVPLLRKINEIRKDMPLIFTFRTKNQGGNLAIENRIYSLMYTTIILGKLVDIVDIEWTIDPAISNPLIEKAKKTGIGIIMSYHDFDSTPAKQVIVKRLKHMYTLGADIAKIANMPRSQKDVDTIIEASQEMKETGQLFIAISMGELGEFTRVNATQLGSCLTYAALGVTSAPGQVEIEDLIQQMK